MPILQYRRARARVSSFARRHRRESLQQSRRHARRRAPGRGHRRPGRPRLLGRRGQGRRGHRRVEDGAAPRRVPVTTQRRKFSCAPRVSFPRRNEFTTEGGKLHDAVKESMAATGMLERSAKLADEARNKARRRVVYETLLLLDGVPDNITLLPRRASRSSTRRSRSRKTPRTIRTKASASSPAARRTVCSPKEPGTRTSMNR